MEKHHRMSGILSLSIMGRFGRLNYINALVSYAAAVLVIFVPVSALLTMTYYRAEAVGKGYFIFTCVCVLLVFASSARAKVLRLHDLDLSGLIVIPAVLIPIAIIIFEYVYTDFVIFGLCLSFLVELFFMALPGTSGHSRFGPEPHEGTKRGLIVLGMFMVIAAVLAARSFL
jgi:uncharacterized membrane protein YhaH (DUF805 family)